VDLRAGALQGFHLRGAKQIFDDASEMVTHGEPRRLRIVSLQRVKDFAVLSHPRRYTNASGVTKHVHAQRRAIPHVPQIFDHVTNRTVARRRGDRHVKPPVRLLDTHIRAVFLIHIFENGGEFVEPLVRNGRRRQCRGFSFEQDARLRELERANIQFEAAHFRGWDPGDINTGAAPRLDQAPNFQCNHRFPNRRPADLELLGEVALGGQAHAGLVTPLVYGRGNGSGNLLIELAGIRGHNVARLVRLLRVTHSKSRRIRDDKANWSGQYADLGPHLPRLCAMLKITNARVIVTRPGRNFVTLKIETQDGVYGLGDATLNGRELAVVSYLEDHVVPCLIGRDAHRIEDIWQYLYRGAYWRRGPVTMSAIAAVDMALWDIKGKVAGLPVYQLLGGAARDGVMVYGHANGVTVDDTISQALHYRDLGYKAIRLQTGVPGLPSTYGVSKDKMYYEPADGSLPTENVWSTSKYMLHTPKLFAAAREALGWDVHLLHDVHHRLTPLEAGRLGKDLEPYRLFWMEDATPAENQEGFRLIRQHTTTPLAVGEIFSSIWDCKQLIEEQLIDYIRATVVHAGGITHLRRIAALADLYQIRTGCHGATDLSPVTMAAALHFDLSIPNFGVQEYMRHTPETDAVFPHHYTFEDGYLHPGNAPGLGVDLDEVLAAKYPYERAYLPVNRLEDGSMHSW